MKPEPNTPTGIEGLLAELSAGVVTAPAGRLGLQIETALERLVTGFAADAGHLALLVEHPGIVGVPAGSSLQLAGALPSVRAVASRGTNGDWLEWFFQGPGVSLPPYRCAAFARDYPWLAATLERGETILLPGVSAALPSDAAAERDYCARAGVQSGVVVPIKSGGRFLGALTLVSIREPRAWPGLLVKQLEEFAGLLAHTLARQRAEQALRDAQERYQVFLANTVEGIWRLETEFPIPVSLSEEEQTELIVRHGYVAESNEAYAQMHGLAEASDMVGRRLSGLLARSEPRSLELVREFVRGGYRLFDVEICVGDTSRPCRWFSITMTGIVEHGHLARAWGAQRDVSQRQHRLAEEWQATFDAIRDPVMVLDCDNRIRRANASAVAFLGRPLEQIAGQPCHAARQGTLVPCPECPVATAVQTKAPVEAELYLESRSMWVLAGAYPVLDRQGAVVSVVHTLKDVTERKAAEADVDHQLRFERLISSISARLIQAPTDRVSPEIREALRQVREFLDLDRTALLEVAPDQASVTLLESCTAPGCPPPLPGVVSVVEAFPWTFQQVIHRGQCVLVPAVDELPEEARVDRTSCLEHGIKSMLGIPLSVSASVAYVITGVAVRREHQDLDEYIPRLRLLGDILVNALARQNAQQKVRESEDFSRTVLSSLQDQIAVLDRDGAIVAVNDAWMKQPHPDGAGALLGGMGAGTNYLRVCRGAAEAGDPHAATVLAGIESVLDGSRRRFSCEYHGGATGPARWFEVVAQPLNRPAGGAIVSLVNITNQRQAEAEARKLRDELAHVTRVATLGELVASLAHELNQPLTAILSNAQAAQRRLAAGPMDAAELQEILADIVADDQRAGEVIRRMRLSLKKGPWQPQRLDLNRLVREVAQMVRSDALLRRVSVALDLAPELPPVLGDSIQLQQVVLNLITNAMDAMEATPAGERSVRVLTRQPRSRQVEVAVRDRGTGIPPEKLLGVFEPFFTTKSSGLGMGLAISRSLIQAHYGHIEAANDPDGGAIVRFTLPTADAPDA